MPYGPTQVWTCGAASGASTSSYIDLGGKSYSKLALNAVTMSTGAMITVYGCSTADGTYGPVYERIQNTSTVGYQALTIATTTSGGWGVFNAPPFRYLQFVTSAVVSGGVSYTVIAND
jgi:hypothetical protein